jgi:hypothetical protein
MASSPADRSPSSAGGAPEHPPPAGTDARKRSPGVLSFDESLHPRRLRKSDAPNRPKESVREWDQPVDCFVDGNMLSIAEILDGRPDPRSSGWHRLSGA